VINALSKDIKIRCLVTAIYTNLRIKTIFKTVYFKDSDLKIYVFIMILF